MTNVGTLQGEQNETTAESAITEVVAAPTTSEFITVRNFELELPADPLHLNGVEYGIKVDQSVLGDVVNEAIFRYSDRNPHRIGKIAVGFSKSLPRSLDQSDEKVSLLRYDGDNHSITIDIPQEVAEPSLQHDEIANLINSRIHDQLIDGVLQAVVSNEKISLASTKNLWALYAGSTTGVFMGITVPIPDKQTGAVMSLLERGTVGGFAGAVAVFLGVLIRQQLGHYNFEHMTKSIARKASETRTTQFSFGQNKNILELLTQSPIVIVPVESEELVTDTTETEIPDQLYFPSSIG